MDKLSSSSIALKKGRIFDPYLLQSDFTLGKIMKMRMITKKIRSLTVLSNYKWATIQFEINDKLYGLLEDLSEY